MDISFIIPAYNEEKNIARCLQSILNVMKSQVYSFEIIVCDHSSSDSTLAIANSLGVRTIVIPRGGNVSMVRNKGTESAQAGIYVFLDADTELAKQWGDGLPMVIESLRKRPWQIVGSFCIPPMDSNYIIQNWFKLTTQAGSGYLGTAHMITSRQLFEMLKGFKEDLVTGEDYDFCTRAKIEGALIDIRSQLLVYHHDYPRNIRDFVRREIWHGEGDYQSLSNIVKSKIALLTIVFISMHVLLVICLIAARMTCSLYMVIAIMLFGIFCTFFKFKRLKISTVLKSAPIMYIYFVGRSLSLMKVISKKIRDSFKR